MRVIRKNVRVIFVVFSIDKTPILVVIIILNFELCAAFLRIFRDKHYLPPIIQHIFIFDFGVLSAIIVIFFVSYFVTIATQDFTIFAVEPRILNLYNLVESVKSEFIYSTLLIVIYSSYRLHHIVAIGILTRCCEASH